MQFNHELNLKRNNNTFTHISYIYIYYTVYSIHAIYCIG